MKFQESHHAFTIGIFDSESSANAKAFIAHAESDRDDKHIYAISTSSAVMKKLSVKANTITVLKNFDELRNDLVVKEVNSDELGEASSRQLFPLLFFVFFYFILFFYTV